MATSKATETRGSQRLVLVRSFPGVTGATPGMLCGPWSSGCRPACSAATDAGATGSSATSTGTTGRSATGTVATGSSATGTVATGSSATGTVATGRSATGAAASRRWVGPRAWVGSKGGSPMTAVRARTWAMTAAAVSYTHL